MSRRRNGRHLVNLVSRRRFGGSDRVWRRRRRHAGVAERTGPTQQRYAAHLST